jgi:hypothetical protein
MSRKYLNWTKFGIKCRTKIQQIQPGKCPNSRAVMALRCRESGKSFEFHADSFRLRISAFFRISAFGFRISNPHSMIASPELNRYHRLRKMDQQMW